MNYFSGYSNGTLANLWSGNGTCGLGTVPDEYTGPCGPGAYLFLIIAKQFVPFV